MARLRQPKRQPQQQLNTSPKRSTISSSSSSSCAEVLSSSSTEQPENGCGKPSEMEESTATTALAGAAAVKDTLILPKRPGPASALMKRKQRDIPKDKPSEKQHHRSQQRDVRIEWLEGSLAADNSVRTIRTRVQQAPRSNVKIAGDMPKARKQYTAREDERKRELAEERRIAKRVYRANETEEQKQARREATKLSILKRKVAQNSSETEMQEEILQAEYRVAAAKLLAEQKGESEVNKQARLEIEAQAQARRLAIRAKKMLAMDAKREKHRLKAKREERKAECKSAKSAAALEADTRRRATEKRLQKIIWRAKVRQEQACVLAENYSDARKKERNAVRALQRKIMRATESEVEKEARKLANKRAHARTKARKAAAAAAAALGVSATAPAVGAADSTVKAAVMAPATAARVPTNATTTSTFEISASAVGAVASTVAAPPPTLLASAPEIPASTSVLAQGVVPTIPAVVHTAPTTVSGIAAAIAVLAAPRAGLIVPRVMLSK